MKYYISYVTDNKEKGRLNIGSGVIDSENELDSYDNIASIEDLLKKKYGYDGVVLLGMIRLYGDEEKKKDGVISIKC